MNTLRRQSRTALTLVLGALLVATAPAAARPRWIGPVRVFPGAAPSVGMDGAGDLIAAWADSAGSVRSSVRPAGADWGPDVTLSAPGEDSHDYGPPHVAVGSAGDAVVVWSSALGVRADLRSPGADFGMAQTVDPKPGTMTTAAMNAHGDGVAVWLTPGYVGGNVRTAFRPRRARFGAPRTIRTSDFSRPSAALAAIGETAWRSTRSMGRRPEASRHAGASSPPTTRSGPSSAAS